MHIKITNATVITNNSADEVLHDATICIADGKITHVGCNQDAPAGAYEREIDAKGNIVMPGFFNLHTHIPMTLFRGYADDLALKEWLFEKIFPAEEKLTDEMVYWASLATMCEFAAAGIVGFNEMYSNCDAMVDAADKSGIRAVIARGVVTSGEKGTELRLKEAVETYEKHHGKGRIKIFMSPHAQYTCENDTLARVAELAKKYDTGIHTHVSETQNEHTECMGGQGKTPIRLFEELGLLDVPFIAAHCVWVNDEDIAILAKHNATVATCPRSNLKLASGIAPVKKMMDAGVNVGLGTDGAASNNKLSMMSEMTFASMLQKGITGDPEAIPAQVAIRMATQHGAQALGFNSGTIETGKNADIIMLDCSGIRYAPQYNPISSVVYAGSDCDVCMTMVGGDIIYENGMCIFADIGEIEERLAHFAKVIEG